MQSSFKYKPDKIKYLSNVNTLDNTHRKIIAGFEKQKLELPIKSKRIEKYAKQLEDLQNKNKELYTPEDTRKKSWLKSEMNKLKDEIEDMETKEIEYYSKIDSVILDYYDIVEKTSGNQYIDDNIDIDDSTVTDTADLVDATDTIDNPNVSGPDLESLGSLESLNLLSQQRRKERKPAKKRRKFQVQNSTNILDFFSGPQENGQNKAENGQNNGNLEVYNRKVEETNDIMNKKRSIVQLVSNKATLFDDYMTLIDTGYNSAKKQKYNPIRKCENCNIEKTLVHAEGLYVCTTCGEVEHIIIESEVPNYKDPVQEKPSYPYKRQNHLSESQVRVLIC